MEKVLLIMVFKGVGNLFLDMFIIYDKSEAKTRTFFLNVLTLLVTENHIIKSSHSRSQLKSCFIEYLHYHYTIKCNKCFLNKNAQVRSNESNYENHGRLRP